MRLWRQWRCRHDVLRNIYGDEAMARRARSECMDCGKTWDELARRRPDPLHCPLLDNEFQQCVLPLGHLASCLPEPHDPMIFHPRNQCEWCAAHEVREVPVKLT